ncbi:MAG: hypothetical protein EHM24_05735 [Acidobacteria bacterium]|nr:MAG: hypothetical protein EHM24_05735 [Acidobacteriota bacterium]
MARQDEGKRASGCGGKVGVRTSAPRASAARKGGGAAKAAGRKRAAKKAGARKGSARKTAARPGGARKTAAKRPAARKTANKRAASRKTAGRAPGRKAATGGGQPSTRGQARGAKRAGAGAGGRRRLWVESPDQHAERPGQTLATRNHEVIKAWAEERGAVPATVPGTEHDGRPGVLRFDFPNFGGGRLRQVDWDEWFETFDTRNLVFLFQEQMKDGRQSNFFRLDNPEREEG